MTDASASKPQRPIPHHWVLKAMEVLYGPLSERPDSRPPAVLDPKDDERQ